MASKNQLKAKFDSTKQKRTNLNTTRILTELLQFIDSSVRKQFQFSFFSFTICGGERRFKIDPYFQKAFVNLSLQERISYYELGVNSLYDNSRETSLRVVGTEQSEADEMSINVIKGLRNGPYKIKLPSYIIDCGHYDIELKHFLLRKSKKHENNFIYEHTKNEDPLSIRFSIADHSERKERILMEFNSSRFVQYILALNEGSSEEKPQIVLNKIENSPTHKEYSEINIHSKSNLSPHYPNKYSQLEINTEQINQNDISVVETLIKKDENNDDEMIYDIMDREEQHRPERTHTRYRKNICEIMLPHFSLAHLDNLSDFLPIYRNQNKRMYIYGHAQQKGIYRLQMYLNEKTQEVVKQLCQIQNYKLWNHCINESHIKISITSDNANLVYLKQKAHSEWFRERDFLFLRHLCKIRQQYYIIDRSVENLHFIPFQSILRGQIHYCVTKVEPIDSQQSKLILEINLEHGGLLLFQAKQQLLLSYLKEYQNLQNFIHRFKKELKNSFDLNWEIQPTAEQSSSNLMNQHSLQNSHLFDSKIQRIEAESANEDEFYSINENEQVKLVYEISQEERNHKRQLIEIKELNPQYIQLNEEGLSILPKLYLSTNHLRLPFPKAPPRRSQQKYQNMMLKEDFEKVPTGGMKLINQRKAAALDNVMKFIMSRIRSNILSGENPFSLSLPVEIFHTQSNLQKLCHGMSYAPDYLEKANRQTPLERFKNCIVFAFTNSICYFDLDKVFNPILGETYQGFIDGCPLYAEQVSHHPPISSVLMIGRGYRIHASLESKVYLHLNSGDGVNEGFYNIQFEDGGRVVFQTCPGQMAGLNYGDRLFNFIGKTYIVDSKNKLFCSLNFEDESGFFSKNKWKYKDQIEGYIYKVTDGFIRRFFQTKTEKKAISPTEKDIQQTLGQITGRWLQQISIDGAERYNLQSKPFELMDYEYPLHSNSNYREDLLYKKRNDLARSQKEKERLEVLQRHDRKMRDKYHKGKH